jgi:RES domain-containing protein
MSAFYRIVQTRWAASAMNGEGARLWGGRWNSPGISAVYLAESRSLAALEILVHAPREALLLDWSLIEVRVPDDSIQTIPTKNLPSDWRDLPSSPNARNFGDSWLRQPEKLAFKLPSTIIPQERILLLNPTHPDAAKLKISSPQAFCFDKRFIEI